MKTKIIAIDEWWLPLGIGFSSRMKPENLIPRQWKKRHINPEEIVEIKEITLSKSERVYGQVILSSGESFYTLGPVEKIVEYINNSNNN